ncbi:MAG: hypothetical protein RL228_1144 [Actinomycetota bacterium]|jgi:hypothetical protein
MSDQKLLTETRNLWQTVVENEVAEDVESDTVFGALYAELALRNVVELTPSGIEKVKASHTTLSELAADLDQVDEEDEEEDED